MNTVGCASRGKGVVAPGDATRHLEVDALVVVGLRVDQLIDDLAPALARIWIADLHLAETALQAGEVLVEAESDARVHRHELVDAVAEDEAAVEHRHLRFLERHQLAVEENQVAAFYLIHWNHSLSVSQALPSNPAWATFSSATTGYSA
jgi:hypothetical protein